MKSKDEMMIDEAWSKAWYKHIQSEEAGEPMLKGHFYHAFQAGQASERAKVREVLNYCKPHTEQMLAARIVGILLGCDFRDAKEALAAYESEGERD